MTGTTPETTPTDLARVSACISAFPADVVGQIVLASSDLCLMVGPDLAVQDVVVGFALQDTDCESWRGAPLRTLVAIEGQRKIDLLWAAPANSRTGWRHLNFRTRREGVVLPLLVQRIAAQDGRSVLVCRDLRPAARMQEQLNRALIEVEQRHEDAVHGGGQGGQLARAANDMPDVHSVQASAMLREAISSLGEQPLSQIVAQTARVLEEVCIREAYAQCHYDLAETAQCLGIETDELSQRMTFFRRKD